MLCFECEGMDAAVVEAGDVLAVAVPLIRGAELQPRDGGEVIRATPDAFTTTTEETLGPGWGAAVQGAGRSAASDLPGFPQAVP